MAATAKQLELSDIEVSSRFYSKLCPIDVWSEKSGIKQQPWTVIGQPAIEHINEAIRASDALLQLEDDWDGEGAQRISKTTLDRAASFLKSLAVSAYKNQGIRIPAPVIGPADRGSIDLFWQGQGFEFLINFPNGENERPSFYGRRDDGNTSSGRIGSNERPDIATFLSATV